MNYAICVADGSWSPTLPANCAQITMPGVWIASRVRQLYIMQRGGGTSPGARAGLSQMTKSALSYPPLEGPWRGRVGSGRARRDTRRGGVIVHPQPINPVLLAAHPTPALRTKRCFVQSADPPPPGEGKKNLRYPFHIRLPCRLRGEVKPPRSASTLSTPCSA